VIVSAQSIGRAYDVDMLIIRSAHEELRRWLTEWNRPELYVTSSFVEYV
jgi:hypothetical protein